MQIYKLNYVELAMVISWNKTKPSAWAKERIIEYGNLSFKDRLRVLLKRTQAMLPFLDELRYFLVSKILTKEEKKMSKLVSEEFTRLEKLCG